MNIYLKIVLRWLLLTLALIICQGLIGSIIQIPEPELFANIEPSIISFVIISASEAAVMYLLFSRLVVGSENLTRLKLGLLIFVIFWGTKCLQMQIEAWFFLNIWQSIPIMSNAMLLYVLGTGFVGSILFCLLAIIILPVNQDKTTDIKPDLPNAMALIKTSALYVVIYFLAGMFLAIPLSGTSFDQTYQGLNVPMWMPVFQFVRGLLWCVIIGLIVRFHTSKHDSRITVALCLCVFSTIQIIYPNPYMQEQLRYAHLVELAISMSLFGWLGAWIIRDKKAG